MARSDRNPRPRRLVEASVVVSLAQVQEMLRAETRPKRRMAKPVQAVPVKAQRSTPEPEPVIAEVPTWLELKSARQRRWTEETAITTLAPLRPGRTRRQVIWALSVLGAVLLAAGLGWLLPLPESARTAVPPAPSTSAALAASEVEAPDLNSVAVASSDEATGGPAEPPIEVTEREMAEATQVTAAQPVPRLKTPRSRKARRSRRAQARRARLARQSRARKGRVTNGKGRSKRARARKARRSRQVARKKVSRSLVPDPELAALIDGL